MAQMVKNLFRMQETWSGWPPGEKNDYPVQRSCLENWTEDPGGLQSVGSQKSQTRLTQSQ